MRWLLLLGLVAGVAFGGYLILGVMELHQRYWEYPNWVTPIVAGGCITAATILWFIKRLPDREPPKSPAKSSPKRWPPKPKSPDF